MNELKPFLRDRFTLGLTASAIVHVVLISLFLFNWDFMQEEPKAEETVSVKIVPPPEEEQPPQQEEAKDTEPPKPPDEPPAEEQVTTDTPAPVPPLTVFNPVFEFGEEDSGPEIAADGNSSTGDNNADEPGLAEKRLEETAKPLPEDAAPAPPNTELAANTSDTTIASLIEDPSNLSPGTGEKKPTTPEKPETSEELQQARTIYSQTDGNGAAAVAAMKNLPRGIRGGRLCTTELAEQLSHATLPYNATLLPGYVFPEGNEMTVRRGAFRTRDGWFNVQFRCVINDEATRITGFSLKVGEKIPRSEWAKRKLPTN